MLQLEPGVGSHSQWLVQTVCDCWVVGEWVAGGQNWVEGQNGWELLSYGSACWGP